MRVVGERRGEIGIKRALSAGDAGLGFHRGVDQRERHVAALEIERGGDRRGDADAGREGFQRAGFAHADQSAADAVLAMAVFHGIHVHLRGRDEGGEPFRLIDAVAGSCGETQLIGLAAGFEGERAVPHAAVVGGAQQHGEIGGGLVVDDARGLAGAWGVQQRGRLAGGIEIERGALFRGQLIWTPPA